MLLLAALHLICIYLIIKTHLPAKSSNVLIIILYKRDALFLGKRRLVYLANVMMRANDDIPTSVRAQEFLPGILRTPHNRVLHSNSIHGKKEKKGEEVGQSHTLAG